MARHRRTLRAALLHAELRYSLKELCTLACLSAETVLELVAEGVLEPEGGGPPQAWRFGPRDLRRAQLTVRLTRDLKVNLPGAALALELLEELEALRRLERHLLRLDG